MFSSKCRPISQIKFIFRKKLTNRRQEIIYIQKETTFKKIAEYYPVLLFYKDSQKMVVLLIHFDFFASQENYS